MTDPKNNPYIDEALLNAYATYSPAENSKYLADHGASQTTQQIAATTTTMTTAQQTVTAQQFQTYTNYPADSQREVDDIPDEEIVGPPINNPDAPPLSLDDISKLKKGDILWMLDDNDGAEEQDAWQQVTFIRQEHDGFAVQTNKLMPTKNDNDEAKYEEVFCPTMDEQILPILYRADTNNDDNNNNNNNNTTNDIVDSKQNENGVPTDYTIKDFNYNKGAQIFVYDDANNFIPYTIESYDPKTTKAALKDASNVMTELYLKNFKHESGENSKSKAIPIETNNTSSSSTKNDGPPKKLSRLGKYIDIATLTGLWHWVQRTNSMKLKWISYKNTLLGTIAVATKHLYPISLDYKTLMFISGKGLGFNWLDIEEEEEEEEENEEDEKKGDNKDDDNNKEDIIEEHMKLFLNDSNLDIVLNKISKYSYYKFERHTISEMLNSGDAVRRLLELEQLIVKKINENVCSITNDENGHLALIVGYISKPPSAKLGFGALSPTTYYFKIKKFGVFDGDKNQIEKEEYVAIDLYNQHIVITMDPPNKDKQYSLQHTFNPDMLLKIISDLIVNYEAELNMKQEIDLFGRNALKKFAQIMNKAKGQQIVSDELAKLTVFALIRLFDSRKTSIEYINYIQEKIKNAFHSQTGSEEEWKFKKEYDISSELKLIEKALRIETSAIRRQQKVFECYILNYDGKPLVNIEWEPFDRAAIKAALDEIMENEETIILNLKKLKDKLEKYQLSSKQKN